MTRKCLVCKNEDCWIKRSALRELNDAEDLLSKLEGVRYDWAEGSDSWCRTVSLYDEGLLQNYNLSDTNQNDLKRLHLFILDNRHEDHNTIHDILYCKLRCISESVYYLQEDDLYHSTYQDALSNKGLLRDLIFGIIKPYVGSCQWLEKDKYAADYDYVCSLCIAEYRRELPNLRVTVAEDYDDTGGEDGSSGGSK